METPTLRHALGQLEPLHVRDAETLWPAAADPEIWRYFPHAPPADVAELEAWIRKRLNTTNHTWVSRDADGGAAGTTSLYSLEDGRCTIGYTWLGQAWWQTGLNRQNKRALLDWAFASGIRRVEFRVDGRNQRSQQAMLGIGATREGVLRQHDRLWDGYVRDAHVFSILADEWQSLRPRLAQSI